MKRAVSLILILSLILAIFAIPAQASAVGTGIIITASAASVISAALIGLGVMPGTDGTTFDGIVSGAADYLATLGFGDGVVIPILKYLGPGGGIQYALQSTVMQALRSWLFEEDVVTSSIFPYEGLFSFSSNRNWSVKSADGDPYSLFVAYIPSITHTSPYNVIFVQSSSNGATIYDNGSFYVNRYPQLRSNGYYSCNLSIYVFSNITDFLPTFTFSSIDEALEFLPSSFSSSYDVSLGDVSAPDTSLAAGYPNWAVDSVQVDPGGDDEDPVPYIPIGLGDTLEEIQSSTQEDVQSGSSTLETPNQGTEVNISGEVGGSLIPDGGGSGDLPGGEGSVTVDDLTTMFAWLAVRIDEAVESLFPDLQVIKTYLKAISQWHETENVKYDSMLSYFSGWDTDFDTMLTNLANIDLNLTTLVDHAGSSVDLLSAIASDVQDIRDVIADPLDGDINEEEHDNKNAFLNTFSKKSQADNIGDLSGLSDGFTEWFSLDVDPSLLFDQMDTGFIDWFTSETAQAISIGGGAAATGISLMDDAEYEDPETPYLDAWDQEVQNILSGGDGEW